MYRWAISALIAAQTSAIFGFGGLTTTFDGIAQVLFGIFLGLFLIMMLATLVRQR